MSMDVSLDARQIAESWPLVVGKLPADLAGCLAAFEEAAYVQAPGGGMPVEKITAKNVGEAITGLAEAYAIEDAFTKAHRQVRDLLAYRVLNLAGEAVPELIERMEPDFDAAVAEFRAAVDSLPPEHGAAALIAAGPSAVEAYHRAVAAQQKLNQYGNWINSLHSLPAFRGFRREPALKLIRPSTRAEFKLLLDAGNRRTDSELNPVYVAAIEAGLPWQMLTPAEAQAVADEINAQPVEKNPNMRFVRW